MGVGDDENGFVRSLFASVLFLLIDVSCIEWVVGLGRGRWGKEKDDRTDRRSYNRGRDVT